MYSEFFGFTQKPFNITPDPTFLFLSRTHREAFAHLWYGLRQRAGFIEITGEVGTGKTTVLRTLLGQLQEEDFRTAFIFNPRLSSLDLLRSINREFGIPADGSDRGELLAALNAFLLEENARGRTVVLVIDEAQNLAPEVLEEIRLLSNLETETEKLVQIVLAGQPELARVLSRTELRQLSQRITVRYHLRTMDYADACAYIGHRLEVAGSRGEVTFTRGALRRIYRFSGGLPRRINVLCDRALLVAFTRESRRIDASAVVVAAAELRRERGWLTRRRPWRPAIAAALTLTAALLLLQMPLRWPAGPHPSAESPSAETAASPKPAAIDELRRILGREEEGAVARAAFNALADAWRVPPLTGESLLTDVDIENAARSRGLKVASFRGSLDELLRLDTPALLELILPGVPGKRYLALVGAEGERLRIAPPVAGRESLTRSELTGLWFGRAYLPWRNFAAIPFLYRPGTAVPGTSALQELLRRAGFLRNEDSGVYDAATISAVTRFQVFRGIAPDGRVGPQTLLALYQETGALQPRLGQEKEGADR